MAIWYCERFVRLLYRLGPCSLGRAMCSRSVSCFTREELSEDDKRMWEIYYQTRLERFGWFTTGGLWLGCPLVLAACGATLLAGSSDPFFLQDYIVEGILPDSIVLAISALYFSTFKNQLSNPLADFIYGLVFLSLGVHTTFSSNEVRFGSNVRAVQGTQMLIAVAVGDFRRILIPNVLNLLWQVFVIFSTEALHKDAQSNLIDVSRLAIFVLIVANLSQTWLVEQAKAMVREMKASRSEATLKSLLGVMCDAVVHLKADLTLRERCPQLAALLLRGAAMPGDSELPPFTRYVHESDRARFEDFISAETLEPGHAQSIHISLVDSMGQLVRVQLFHAAVLDLSSQVSHLIGITEDRDNDAFMVRESEPCTPAPVREHLLDLESIHSRRSSSAEAGSRSAWSEGSHWSGSESGRSRSRRRTRAERSSSSASWDMAGSAFGGAAPGAGERRLAATLEGSQRGSAAGSRSSRSGCSSRRRDGQSLSASWDRALPQTVAM